MTGRISRREFLKLAAILGLPFSPGLAQEQAHQAKHKVGKVAIIGAGAAGLSAAYLLAQQDVEFEVLEAQSHFGGRFKVNKTFTDFPLPLGAEWLHRPPSELRRIINDSSVDPEVELRPYNQNDSLGYYEDGAYSSSPVGDTGDSKFIASSWSDFFETYILPTVRPKIRYETVISEVDYRGSRVTLTDQNERRQYVADKVIVTVPLRLLQLKKLVFVPELPKSKRKAIKKAKIWSGIKIFIEFSQKFFPTVLAFPNSQTQFGQRYIYDASCGQNSDSKVLGVFAVGRQAEDLLLLSDEERIERVIAELDEIFDGAASRSYVKHLVQNWNAEPFARGAYLADVSPSWVPAELSKPVSDRLFFAGEAYTEGEDWGGVHDAARSARKTVEGLRSRNWSR